MTTRQDVRLLDAMRRTARWLTAGAHPDRDAAVQRIVECAVDTVPAAAGGISLTIGGVVESAHATSADAHRLDRLQSELHQGPCITAASRPPPSGVVYARNLGVSDHDRWPLFAVESAALGYRSVLSLQLSNGPGDHSALNLYAHDPDAFDEAARMTATLFGLQAATLLHGEKAAEELRHVTETRDLIGQAKGVLTERFHLSDGDAFQMLVESAQSTNTGLVDVAGWVLDDARRSTRGPISEPRRR